MGLWLLIFSAVAQIHPDAPILDFRLPMFGESGYKIWDLKGRELHYKSDDQLEVIGMKLTIYRGDAALTRDSEFISPQAMIYLSKRIARGDSALTVRGPNFIIKGRHWLWDGDERRIYIGQGVRVTFFDDISSLLK